MSIRASAAPVTVGTFGYTHVQPTAAGAVAGAVAGACHGLESAGASYPHVRPQVRPRLAAVSGTLLPARPVPHPQPCPTLS